MKHLLKVNLKQFFKCFREYLYLSSSLVKEIAINGGELDKFVPECIEGIIITRKINESKK